MSFLSACLEFFDLFPTAFHFRLLYLRNNALKIKKESEAKDLTDKENLIRALETEYLPKIYGFCILKLGKSQDAEDLSQEICLEVLKAIRAGKHIDNFGALVYSISNHMFYNLLRRKKHGTTAYLTDIILSEEDPEEEYLTKEQKDLLRRELALMSGDYRKAVIMHYFENMSCEEIGSSLGKSTGTVKWWLHDARKAIEKGMNTMRKFGEKSYRPGSLMLSCQGNPGINMEPMSLVSRKSTQNILLAAYKAPLSISELCSEMGIPAPYIEDEVASLVENELMKEVSKGKYQTDFVILPGNNPDTANKIYECVFPEYYESLISFLEQNKALLTSERFNTAGFEWNRLLWVYIHIITETALDKYKYEDKNIALKYQDIPIRPKGGRWIALGFDNSIRNTYQWEDYHNYDGPVHKSANVFVQGFFHTWSGADSSIFFDTPDEVFDLSARIVNGSLGIENLDEEQKYIFSIALEKKLFIRTDKGFKQNFYYVAKNEYAELQEMACAFYKDVLPLLEKAYGIILQERGKNVPEHLRWQMGNFLSNNLTSFVPFSLYKAVKQGKLSLPDENNKTWLSLFVSEYE